MPAPKPPRHVAVAIAYDRNTQRVLMITSRKHPHLWILPKGGVEQGETSGQAAVREAWEEAGTPKHLIAPVDSATLLSLDLPAPGKRSSVWHIHALEVSEAEVEGTTDWPENNERKRCFVTTEECLVRIREWYTDTGARSDLLEHEGFPGDLERDQEVKKGKATKKEAKGGAMETAFMAFLSARNIPASPRYTGPERQV